MQGNERNKIELEEEFISEAWESMRFMLDQEMPVGTTPPAAPQERRSDRGLLLLLLLVCFGAGASLMYWYQQPTSPQPNTTSPQNEITATPATPIATLKTTTEPTTNKTQTQSTLTQTSVPQNQTPITTTPNPTTQNSNPQNSPIHQPAHSPTAQLKTTTPQSPNQKINTPPVSFKWVPADNPSAARKEIASFAVLLHRLDPMGEKSTSLKPKTKLLKEKRWDYFVEAALIRDDGTKEFGGFSTGLNVSYRLNPRFSVQTGLGWHRLAKTPSNPLNENNNIVATNETDLRGGNSNNLTIIDPIDLEASSAPISTLDYLQMPMQLSYNITKQLRVYSGCHVGYYLNSIGANKENPNETPFAQLTEAEQVEILADTRNRYARRGLRKFEFGFQGGMSFVTKRKLGVFITYNLGVRDISDNAFFDFKQIHNNRYLQLGLNYYLFNR